MTCAVGRKKGIEMNILSSEFKYTPASHTDIRIGWRKAGWEPSETRKTPNDEMVASLLNELNRFDPELADFFYRGM